MRLPRRLAASSLPRSRTPLLALAALALGLLIARLPLEYSVPLFAAVVVLAASVWEPALGLGFAVVFGPAKALLSIARPDLPSDPGQIFFALAAAGWLARGLAQRRIFVPRIPLLFPLGLYIVVGLFSLLSARALDEGLRESLKWVEIAVATVILVSEAQRGRAKWIVGGILAAGLAQAALGVWQYEFRGTGPEHFRILGDHYRAYGSFEQPNPYGGFLGLIWPVAAGLGIGCLMESGIGRRAKLLVVPSFLLLAAILLAALYVSFSRGAWLGAAAAGAVMVVALPRRWGVGIMLAVAALALGWGLARAGLLPASVAARLAPQFSPRIPMETAGLDDVADFTQVADVRGVNINDANFAIVERLAHWQAAEAMARARPWLGVGLGNYAAAYPEFGLLNWPHPLGHAHMIYLNVLAETGVAGLVTYVILWAGVIALTMRVVRRGDGVRRGLALGLLGAWVHLSVHQIVDNLYVNNLHFLIAALFALLTFYSQDTLVDDSALHPPVRHRAQPAPRA
jgi:O-antigen ligase